MCSVSLILQSVMFTTSSSDSGMIDGRLRGSWSRGFVERVDRRGYRRYWFGSSIGRSLGGVFLPFALGTSYYEPFSLTLLAMGIFNYLLICC